MIDAYAGGLFLFVPCVEAIICVPRPLMHMADDRLHRRDGPAVEWAQEAYWFWRGVEVPRWVIENPAGITADAIRQERSAAVQRCMGELMDGSRTAS